MFVSKALNGTLYSYSLSLTLDNNAIFKLTYHRRCRRHHHSRTQKSSDYLNSFIDMDIKPSAGCTVTHTYKTRGSPVEKSVSKFDISTAIHYNT
jgi:hypothetical protein